MEIHVRLIRVTDQGHVRMSINRSMVGGVHGVRVLYPAVVARRLGHAQTLLHHVAEQRVSVLHLRRVIHKIVDAMLHARVMVNAQQDPATLAVQHVGMQHAMEHWIVVVQHVPFLGNRQPLAVLIQIPPILQHSVVEQIEYSSM